MQDTNVLQRLPEAWQRNPAAVAKELIAVYDGATTQERADWKRWRKKYRNKGYMAGLTMSQGFRPAYTTNYIHAGVENLIGFMQSEPPTTTATTIGYDSDVDLAVLNELLQHALDRAHFMDRLWTAYRHAAVTNLGWLKVRFDGAAGPDGQIVMDALPRESVMHDPWAPNVESVRWLIHRIPGADPAVLAKRFGTPVDKIKPEKPEDKRGNGRTQRGPLPSADYLEVWVRLPVEPERGEKAQDGAELTQWQVAWVSGGTTLAGPRTWRYPFPYVPVFDVPPDEGLDSVGEAEMIEPLQDQSDELDERIRRLTKKIEDRVTLVDPNRAGIGAADLRNRSGAMDVMDTSPDAVRQMEAPTFPAELLRQRAEIPTRIQEVTGISPLMAGGTPGVGTSGVALSVEAELAQKRIETRRQALRASVRDAAVKVLRLIFTFYTDERVIRIGQDKYVHIFPDYPRAMREAWDKSQLDAEALTIAKSAWRRQNGIDLVMSDITHDFYDIEVETDSARPTTKAAQANLALTLFREHAIDQQALLETLEWPGREEIIERMAMQPSEGTGAAQAAPGGSRAAPGAPGGAPGGAPAGIAAVAQALQGAAAPETSAPGQPAVPQGGMQ